MSKTDIIIAISVCSAAFAAIHLFAPAAQIQPMERKDAMSADRTGWWSNRLSMGPDPGGHTGATVTPDTTKTGQPTADGPGGANRSNASSAAGTGTSGGSDSTKAQHDGAGSQPATKDATTPRSTSAQPTKDR